MTQNEMHWYSRASPEVMRALSDLARSVPEPPLPLSKEGMEQRLLDAQVFLKLMQTPRLIEALLRTNQGYQTNPRLLIGNFTRDDTNKDVHVFLEISRRNSLGEPLETPTLSLIEEDEYTSSKKDLNYYKVRFTEYAWERAGDNTPTAFDTHKYIGTRTLSDKVNELAYCHGSHISEMMMGIQKILQSDNISSIKK